MKAQMILTVMLILLCSIMYAQVAINTTGTPPNGSAMLDVQSTSRGFLVPRMTSAERNLISNPAKGLLVFCTDVNCFFMNKGTPASPEWVVMSSQWFSNGSDIYYTGGKVGVGTSTPQYDLEILGSNTDDGGTLQVGNSDLSHKLSLFSGRQNDPNPFILWKAGDPMRFSTDDGGWSEKMRITSEGRVGIGITSPAMSLDVKDSLGINGTRMIYLPDQTGMEGSVFFGNGGADVGHVSGNQGRFNTGLGMEALTSVQGGSGNTAAGYGALHNNAFGIHNSAFGNQSLYSNTSGNRNTSIGNMALYSNSTGDSNVAVGYRADYYNQEGSHNTMVGFEAGAGNSVHSVSGNVFLGFQAGKNETGSNKLYVANSSENPPLMYGDFSTGRIGLGTVEPDAALVISGDGSNWSKGFLCIKNDDQDAGIRIYDSDSTAKHHIYNVNGYGDKLRICPDSSWDFGGITIRQNGHVGIGSASPVAQLSVGLSSQFQVNDTGNVSKINNVDYSFPSSQGSALSVLQNDGSGNLVWATGVGENDWSRDGNAGTESGTNFIGTTDNQSLDIRTRDTLRVRITTKGQIETYSLNNSVFIGIGAGENNTTGFHNTFLGSFAGYSNTGGVGNVALGYGAFDANESGRHNVAIGYDAMNSNRAGCKAVAIGYEAMKNSDTSGTIFDNTNIAIGYRALHGWSILGANSGTNNTALGYEVLYADSSGSSNVAMGYTALHNNLSGNSNTAQGTGALYNNTHGSNNVAIGSGALSSGYAGSNGTAVGVGAMGHANPTFTPYDNCNVAVGYHALLGNDTLSLNTGNGNTALGYETLRYNKSGSNNVAVGNVALYYNTTGVNNTASGYYALYTNSTGYENTASGVYALRLNTTGHYNTAMGAYSLRNNSEGIDNMAAGYYAAYSNTTGNYNTAIGDRANQYNQQGSYNTIIGYEAGKGSTLHNKSGNVFIGYQAGMTETGNNKLYIANSFTTQPLVWGDFSSGSMALGSNVSTTRSGCFMLGDNSTTFTLSNTTHDDRYIARFAGGYYLYSNSGASVGVALLSGESSWSVLSDVRKKEGFKPVNGDDVLNKISGFNLASWNYKGQDPLKHRHYGPMAQDFYAAFGNDGIGTVGNDTLISSADFDGINFIAIQALVKRTSALKSEVEELKTLNEQAASEIEKNRKELELLKGLVNELYREIGKQEDSLSAEN